MLERVCLCIASTRIERKHENMLASLCTILWYLFECICICMCKSNQKQVNSSFHLARCLLTVLIYMPMVYGKKSWTNAVVCTKSQKTRAERKKEEKFTPEVELYFAYDLSRSIAMI